MGKYIPLDALVAEIDKLKGKVSDGSSYCNGWQHALRMLELSLDTIEVKEVNIDREIGRFFNDECWKDGTFEEEQRDMIKFAKHFFELGLKAQKGEKV